MSTRASIDLGTNTCLLLIADCDSGGSVTRILQDHSQIVKLGEGVDATKTLSNPAMDRALKVLKWYRELVTQAGIKPEDVVAVATSQARDARNGGEFLAKVKAQTGFVFRILSGEQEAKATFLGGLLPGDVPDRVAVVDIGGGSTELMANSGGESLDIGSVRFTERYFRGNPELPPSDEEFWACRAAIDSQLERLLPWRKQLSREIKLVAVAGTATTAASVFLELPSFDRGKIDGLVLSRGDLHRWVEDLKWRNLSEKRKLLQAEAGRAEVILAGAMILWRTLEVLEFDRVQISTRGLRFGVLRI